jgi:hypothetical protein
VSEIHAVLWSPDSPSMPIPETPPPSVKSADISLCILNLPELIHPPASLLYSHPYLIPDDVLQYITPDSLVFLNKHDLISEHASETHVPTIRERVLGLTKHLWVGSVLKSDRGGMDGFMEGLVQALRQRSELPLCMAMKLVTHRSWHSLQHGPGGGTNW